jgi:kumamolisin
MKNNGRRSCRFWLTLGLATGFAGAAFGAPYPRAATPAPSDLGTALSVSGNQSLTVSVALPLPDTAAAQALLEATYTKGSAQYRHFLTPQEFNAQFGPTDATVAQVTKRFESAGLQVTRASSTLLKVTGSTSAIEAAFGVSLHTYEVAATAEVPGYRYHAPTSAPQVSSDIASSVQAVLGLDTRPRFRPHIRHSSGAVKITSTKLSGSVPNTPDMPGLWTVTDFVDYYDVGPLYKEGIEGKHQTIGIVTLAQLYAERRVRLLELSWPCGLAEPGQDRDHRRRLRAPERCLGIGGDHPGRRAVRRPGTGRERDRL